MDGGAPQGHLADQRNEAIDPFGIVRPFKAAELADTRLGS